VEPEWGGGGGALEAKKRSNRHQSGLTVLNAKILHGKGGGKIRAKYGGPQAASDSILGEGFDY